MSAKNMPGSSAGATRASSSTLIPSRTPMSVSSWLPVGVRGLDHRGPERGVMARKDAAAGEAGQRLEPLDRVHGARRIPHDAGRDLLVDRALPVAGVAGEDDWARLREV